MTVIKYITDTPTSSKFDALARSTSKSCFELKEDNSKNHDVL